MLKSPNAAVWSSSRYDRVLRDLEGLPYQVRAVREARDAIIDLIGQITRLSDYPTWRPIETAPIDGTEVWVYVAAAHGLGSFCCKAAYHPDGGWCCDELRETTAWMPLSERKAALMAQVDRVRGAGGVD